MSNGSDTGFLQGLNFIEFLFAFVLIWIIMSLWQRWIDSLVYGTFGLNRDSAYQAFIVAAVVTGIYITLYFSLDPITANLVAHDTLGVSIIEDEAAADAPLVLMDIADQQL